MSASSLLSRLSRLRYRLNQGAPSSGLLRSSSNLGGPAALGPPILMAIYRGGGPAPHWTPIAVSSCSGNSCTPNSNHLSVDHQSITSLPPCPISTVGEHSLTCPTLSPPHSRCCALDLAQRECPSFRDRVPLPCCHRRACSVGSVGPCGCPASMWNAHHRRALRGTRWDLHGTCQELTGNSLGVASYLPP